MEKEIFKDIPEYEGLYQISNLGRVKSLEKKRNVSKNSYRIYHEKILKPVISSKKRKSSYTQVTLCNNTVKTKHAVHHLVLETFVSLCPNNFQARHLDGNPSNNKLSNLAWGTAQDNANDRTLHNHNCPGEKNGNSKLKRNQVIIIKKLLKSKHTHKQIALKYNVSETTISNIDRKVTWKHITDKQV